MIKGRNIYIILFSIAVLGLFIVQYQYLKIGLNLAKVQFNKNIVAASQVIKSDLSTENVSSLFLLENLLPKMELILL